jgi:hypothetical protein
MLMLKKSGQMQELMAHLLRATTEHSSSSATEQLSLCVVCSVSALSQRVADSSRV